MEGLRSDAEVALFVLDVDRLKRCAAKAQICLHWMQFLTFENHLKFVSACHK